MIIEDPFTSRRMDNTCCDTFGLGIYPLLFSTGSIVTIIITYCISVSNNHVYPYFPAISDTGGIKPESNVFGFLLSCCAFLGFVVIFIRYFQFKYIAENDEQWYSRLLWLNRIAFLFGVISIGGTLIVAAFQDRGVSLKMHLVGALSVFGGGIVYCFFQSFLSFRMLSCGMNTRRLCWLRFSISVLALTFFIGMLVTGSYANDYWLKHAPKGVIRAMWKPEIAGYKYNVAANACEWLMAFSLFLFFVSFYKEFNKVRMTFHFRNNNFSLLVPFQKSPSNENVGYYT